MNNYVYIISSLPALSLDWKGTEGFSADAIVQEIRERLSEKDRARVDFMLRGFDADSLTPAFYAEALAEKSGFLRGYFRYDLQVRNRKAKFLNAAFGRPEDQDVIVPEGHVDLTPEARKEVDDVLGTPDILARERGLDDLMWKKIDELTLFHYFDLDVIFSFLAKLHIIDRWLKLDEETGREMFRRLVGEVRGTFKGVEYSANK